MSEVQEQAKHLPFSQGLKCTLFTPPPQKQKKQKKLCITIVFDFSKDDCNTLENSEGETRCIMVYMKVVITRGRDVKR